jgi:lipopolysaccharide/colanic/teichoic acid biosynthesis glycosyltransferase
MAQQVLKVLSLTGACFYMPPFLFLILQTKMQSRSSAFFNQLPQARMASGTLALT